MARTIKKQNISVWDSSPLLHSLKQMSGGEVAAATLPPTAIAAGGASSGAVTRAAGRGLAKYGPAAAAPVAGRLAKATARKVMGAIGTPVMLIAEAYDAAVNGLSPSTRFIQQTGYGIDADAGFGRDIAKADGFARPFHYLMGGMQTPTARGTYHMADGLLELIAPQTYTSRRYKDHAGRSSLLGYVAEPLQRLSRWAFGQ